jgi:anti-sigma factor RsiW
MDAHEQIRELLALAAAGALGKSDEERVARHVASCAECASKLEDWRLLTGGLRRLPTPQPRAAVVEQARALAEARFLEEAEHRWHRGVMIFVVAFAWVLTLASWPLFRVFSAGLLVWFDPRFNQTWLVFAGFTGLLWATGGVAAVLLGRQRQQERRVA